MGSFAHVGLHPHRHSERSEESSVGLRAVSCVKPKAHSSYTRQFALICIDALFML